MSTITDFPQPKLPGEGGTRLLTAADLAIFPTELPSGPVRYELDNGRLITMAPPGDLHGAVEKNFVKALANHVDTLGLGKIRCGEVGIILWRNPDRIVGADVAFIRAESLPIRRSTEGYLETIPELVVEIRSKNDTNSEIERKVSDYLKAGVQVIIVADPEARRIAVHRKDQPTEIFHEGEELAVPELLPGFALSVKEALQD